MVASAETDSGEPDTSTPSPEDANTATETEEEAPEQVAVVEHANGSSDGDLGDDDRSSSSDSGPTTGRSSSADPTSELDESTLDHEWDPIDIQLVRELLRAGAGKSEAEARGQMSAQTELRETKADLSNGLGFPRGSIGGSSSTQVGNSVCPLVLEGVVAAFAHPCS